VKVSKHRATAWAVFLGCTTARRLATEIGISENAAALRLGKARRAGFLRKDGHHYFFVPREVREKLS
jgi:hypothetical protein